jgi:hypothetical protein
LVGYAFGVALFVIPVVARPVGVGFPIWVFVAHITVLLNERIEGRTESGSAS